MSLGALDFLNNSGEYFRFKKTFPITSLHSFNLDYVKEIEPIPYLPKKFLLVIIRNGVSIYIA